ncbi:MAG TPA: response regulator [Candidatus Deferrimicrobium sp.]|nr:response regulator [Candidatus Kapabacteria bacterium]HLP58234.1 response regulator [Candidatus Deferrimicrobium sp.]
MNKQTILIVDDDKEVVRRIQENMLEMSDNYIVKTAENGKNALGILEQEEIDMVILDLEIPEMNGLQVLSGLYNKGIWLPVIIITGSNLNEKDGTLKDFGIVDLIKRPFLPEEVVIKIDDIMKHREKKDLIKNFSLTSILQLIEMEKRTGILTIKIDNENGRMFFKNGKIMDIQVKGLSSTEALEAFMNSLHEDKEISIEYIDHKKDKKIDMTLMEMVIEASRLKDERKSNPDYVAPQKIDRQKQLKHDHLPQIADILNSLKEVENYAIADADGDIIMASDSNYNPDIMNSCIYLWVIGEKMGHEFNAGTPRDLTCYHKGKKRFIQKYLDYIIILDLVEISKLSIFKEKLNELFDKMILKKGGSE